MKGQSSNDIYSTCNNKSVLLTNIVMTERAPIVNYIMACIAYSVYHIPFNRVSFSLEGVSLNIFLSCNL